MMKPCFRIAFATLVICALLAACGPSQTQLDATATQVAADIFSTQTAQAPTATATFTPTPTATITPTPTSTPTPTPTFTPTPTKNPLAAEFVDGKLVLTDAAYDQLLSTGLRLYDQGLYVYEAFLYDAMLEYSLETEQLMKVYNLQHEDYEDLGQYELAIENLKKIIELGYRQAGYLNGLCWDLALINRAEEALPYCDEAVEQDPSGMVLDSRGLVYALLGKYPEAISDFQASLEQDDFPPELVTQRQQWVATLQAGKNPITSQVLEDERGEQIEITVDPWYEGALEMAYLRQQYEDNGYVFIETTINGQAALIGSFQVRNCKAEITLLGDEKEFLGGSSMITGCSHDDMNSQAVNFIFPFSRDLNELAQAIAWNAADLYYVIEGKPISEVTPTYGDFQFTVERTDAGGIIITAKPAE